MSSFAKTDYKNFGPRVGFAYAATPKTTVHGGYGVYYGPGNADAGLRQSQSFGFGFNASPVFASTNNGVTPAFDWDSGFPQNYVRPPSLTPTVVNGSAVAMIGARDGRPPYFQNWSVGVQQEVAANLLVEADATDPAATGFALGSLGTLRGRYPAAARLSPAQEAADAPSFARTTC